MNEPLQFREYESKPRSDFDSSLLARVQAVDERLATRIGDTILDWSHSRVVRARNYVGVLQSGDVQVEVLPKTSLPTADARRNLLYMLSVTGRLRLRDRDLASLDVARQPIFEALVALFVDKLLAQLRRGLDHEYVHREENLGFVRGKLLLSTHLRVNVGHRERVYIGYDDFSPDTWLNRILKAACRVLLVEVRSTRIQRGLREALLIFADVRDLEIERHHLDRVRLSRNSERFADLFSFARLVLFEGCPFPRSGSERTFSLLVPMDRLFEAFIGQLIRRHAADLGYLSGQVALQARGRQRFLLRESNTGQGHYRLKPDVLIHGPGQGVLRVLDTKWKRLDEKPNKRPSDADMYQLHAYASRFQAPLSILLFPHMPGLDQTDFELETDSGHRRRVRVAFVDMNRDLQRSSSALIGELRAALADGSEALTMAGGSSAKPRKPDHPYGATP